MYFSTDRPKRKTTSRGYPGRRSEQHAGHKGITKKRIVSFLRFSFIFPRKLTDFLLCYQFENSPMSFSVEKDSEKNDDIDTINDDQITDQINTEVKINI